MPEARNISTGPRGAWQGATLVMAEPGEVIEADDFEPEWFEVLGEAEEPAPESEPEPEVEPEPSDLGAMKVAELKALAEAEGIDLEDAVKKADIISAIELGREVTAQG